MTSSATIAATDTATHRATHVSPAPARTDGQRRQLLRFVAAGGLLVSVATVVAGSTFWLTFSFTVASGVALPAALLLVARPVSRWPAVLAVLLVALCATVLIVDHAASDAPLAAKAQDGGVIDTRSAAFQTIDGGNPYTHDYSAELGPNYQYIYADGHNPFRNPTATRYTYLPGAFLIHVPLAAAGRALGLGYDPRVLYTLLFAAALMIVVRARPDRPSLGAAAAIGWSSPIVALYLGWGSTDGAAAALVVFAAFWGRRRPLGAGIVLALALSLKAFLVILVIPLAVVEVRRHGWGRLKQWWTLPLTLVLTCLPYLIASPRRFVEDVALYHLGYTKDSYPISGIGLQNLFPHVVRGSTLAVVTLACVVAAFLTCRAVLRRLPPDPVCAIVAGGLALGCLLMAFRTLETNYVGLVTMLAVLGWLYADDLVPLSEAGTVEHPFVGSVPEAPRVR